MTTDQLIAGILEREKGYSDRPADRGGPTNHGITAATLGRVRGLLGPASAAAVQNLTVAEARSIYLAEYLPPFRAVMFPELQAQCIDYGVTSGVETAIEALQTVLGVTPDGLLGPQTIGKLGVEPWPLVNNALVAHRVALFVSLVARDPTQLENFHGWCRRAVQFLVAVTVLVLGFAAGASAQPVAGDGLVHPWTSHRQAADVLSDVSVAASLGLDTWASWQAEDRKHAFVMQAIREGTVIGVSALVKHLVHRTRPDGSDQQSFFSEHTALAASAFGGPNLVFSVPLTIQTGALRIAAGKHWLTDTLAGAGVGFAASFIR